MASLSPVVFLRTILEDRNLRTFFLSYNGSFYGCAGNIRSPNGDSIIIDDHHNIIKAVIFSSLCADDPIHDNARSFNGLILLAAAFNDCVFHVFLQSSLRHSQTRHSAPEKGKLAKLTYPVSFSRLSHALLYRIKWSCQRRSYEKNMTGQNSKRCILNRKRHFESVFFCFPANHLKTVSGHWDLNPGPLAPHASAIAGLRHAPRNVFYYTLLFKFIQKISSIFMKHHPFFIYFFCSNQLYSLPFYQSAFQKRILEFNGSVWNLS